MGKYPIFAILALAFIGIIKLLQVTAFDSEQYTKNRNKSFSSIVEKAKTPKKSEQTDTKFNPTDPESQVAEESPPPVLDRTTSDSANMEVEPVDNFSNSESANIIEAIDDTPSSKSATLSDLKNNYLAPIIAGLPAGQLREDVVIRYYRHSEDDDKVYALKDLGYYIHEKEATETSGLGSNVIYYGNNVPLEDIQIVALTLIDNGIPLKSIEPTRFDWKADAIEIGTDDDLIDKPNLKRDFVGRFSK